MKKSRGVSAVAVFKLAVGLVCFLAQAASAGTLYVNANGANATPPFTNWPTAATNIQDAIDAASPGDLVLVTNGVYATGGRPVNGYALTNRVAVTKALTVQSVNGADVTIIQGYQMVPGPTNGDRAVRCVYLANSAVLIGFTLTNGATRAAGDYVNEECAGGVECASGNAIVSNCVVGGNSAYNLGGGAVSGTLANCTLGGNSAPGGGGAYSSTLNNCTLTGNYGFNGGGAIDCTLNNCTLSTNSAIHGGGVYIGVLHNCLLIGNAAYQGGGAYQTTLILNNCTLIGNVATNSWGGVYKGTLLNCIVYSNLAPTEANYDGSSILSNCCTMPLPVGAYNFTNAPLFVDQAGGNLRLQSNSPCINTGNNRYAAGSTDLDGRPRIVGGTVDIGAYEFQGAGMGEFIGWLQQYGLRTDGSADYTDADNDRMNNWQEWRAGTSPTNALSVLQMLSPTGDVSGVTVSWQSVSGVNYCLERATDLGTQPPFTTLKSNLVGQAGTTVYMDTNAVGAGPFFYRVGVQQ